LSCFLKHFVFHLQCPFDNQWSQSGTFSNACEKVHSSPVRHFPECNKNRQGLLAAETDVSLEESELLLLLIVEDEEVDLEVDNSESSSDSISVSSLARIT